MQYYCLVIPRSLEECIAILHGLTSRWALRYWDAELPTHYLLTCEQYDEVLACFVAAGVEEKMIQIVQDLAATIAMATAHGIVTAQVNRIADFPPTMEFQEYEIRMQGIEILSILLGQHRGRLHPHPELYDAYCRGFVHLYQQIFIDAFYEEQKRQVQEKAAQETQRREDREATQPMPRVKRTGATKKMPPERNV